MKLAKHPLLAAACLGVLMSSSAFAAAPAYTPGDLFMGFRATNELLPGSTQCLLVNIGQASVLRDATSPVVLNLGDIGQDLTDLYGEDWRSRTDILWGVAGSPSNSADVAGDTLPTLYASRVQSTPGNAGGAGWAVSGSSIRAGIAATMAVDLGDNFDNTVENPSTTANSTKAIIQNNGAAHSWRQFMAGGTYASSKDFDAFQEIEALPTSSLSLFRVTSSAAGTYEGYFSVNAAGQVTFTPPGGLTSYATWAAANANNQAHDLDYDHDGVQNGVEFFMGQSGSTFTPNPQIVNNKIVWTRDSTRAVHSFGVQVSTDLATWNPAPVGSVDVQAGSVTYTVLPGQGKYFIRLNVTPTAP